MNTNWVQFIANKFKRNIFETNRQEKKIVYKFCKCVKVSIFALLNFEKR
jgi:hypothetical protein